MSIPFEKSFASHKKIAFRSSKNDCQPLIVLYTTS